MCGKTESRRGCPGTYYMSHSGRPPLSVDSTDVAEVCLHEVKIPLDYNLFCSRDHLVKISLSVVLWQAQNQRPVDFDAARISGNEQKMRDQRTHIFKYSKTQDCTGRAF